MIKKVYTMSPDSKDGMLIMRLEGETEEIFRDFLSLFEWDDYYEPTEVDSIEIARIKHQTLLKILKDEPFENFDITNEIVLEMMQDYEHCYNELEKLGLE